MRCASAARKAVRAKLKRSFSEGVGSIMSLEGGFPIIRLGSAHTDALQLKRDWEAVGNELWSAYDKERSIHSYSPYYDKTGKN